MLGWTAVGTWLAVNLPFAVDGADRVVHVLPVQHRPPGRLRQPLVHRLPSLGVLPAGRAAINLLSLIAFLALTAAVWAIKARTAPRASRGGPWGCRCSSLFLLSNKVYSPQYGLWLLPWFALALPHLWTFLAFSLADVAVFVTRFSWFGRMQGAPGARRSCSR